MSTRTALPLALNIFWGAFLLFQVQPIIARYILPWFGGSPAVWTTAMLFFQLMLLVGYAYTHCLVEKFTLKKQILLHMGLLCVAILSLPITPEIGLRPEGGADPTSQIIWLLLVTVGLPYMMLSATTPLMQAWLARVSPHQEPYGQYALSNAGSILGLLIYPFLLEPMLGVRHQTYLWSGGFILFCGCSAWVSYIIYRQLVAPSPQNAMNPPHLQTTEAANTTNNGGSLAIPRNVSATVTGKQLITWFVLSMTGVIVLLAATNQLCKDVAVIPLLWILPLVVYLGSFIISFGQPSWYHRAFWFPLLMVTIGAVAYLLNQDYAEKEVDLYYQILIYTLAVLASCTVCHGELYRLRPRAERLTLFYLMLSLGGAAGGIFVNLIAPILFPGYWELHLCLLLSLLLAVYLCLRDQTLSLRRLAKLGFAGVWCVGIGIISLYFYNHIQVQREAAIYAKRNFYGVLRVYEQDPQTRQHFRELYHGRISHGSQYLHPQYQARPIAYYGNKSGVGRAISAQRQIKSAQTGHLNLRIGVIGQGVATLAAYGASGDSIHFYEIDPHVSEIASQYFTYIKNTRADVEVIHGDARISLENALQQDQRHQYDVLVVDAFSGDGIPVHLLTREALSVYCQHLSPEGVIAFHISNLHFDLRPVVYGLSQDADMKSVWIERWGQARGEDSNDWVLVTDSEHFYERARANGKPWPSQHFKPILWTDDYANLFAALWRDE